MNKNILWIVGILIILGGTFALFSMGSYAPESSDKLQVTASFYPVYYFASEIGGEYANVINVTPAGAEPHDYEPTPQQIAAITTSALFVMNGAGFEAWGERVIAELPETVTVVEAGEGLATLAGEPHEEHEEEEAHEEEGEVHEEDDHGLYDPHVWLSPALAEGMADAVLAGFVAADPENASYYQARADVLKQELSALGAEFRTGLSTCAKDDFVTSHAAFGYIAKDYNLHQVAITGLSHEAEPSAKELAEIATFARENDVDYIFFETLVSPKLSQTIADEIGAETLVLNPIEGLIEAELREGKTYFTEMRANLANLKTALSCSP